MDFLKNFELVLEALYKKSDFMKEVKNYNFSGQEYATLMTNMGQLALQTTLAIEEAMLKERGFLLEDYTKKRQLDFQERELGIAEERMRGELELKERGFEFETYAQRKQLDIKERELGVMEEKTRLELEIASLNAKANIRQNQAENIKSLVQAESISRSVGDNAAINQANAYLGFLNVMGNAAELATAEKHAQNVIAVLNKINTNDITAYEPIFDKLRREAEEIVNAGEGAKEVWIYAAKSVCEVGEKVKVMGFSVFGDNPVRFIVGGREVESKTILFSAESVGVFEIVFEAQNQSGEWVKDKTQIAVIEKMEF